MPKGMQAIYSQTISNSTTNSMAFNNIPQIYSDLVIRVSARSLASAATNTLFLCFQDGGTNTNYSETYIYGTGSATGTARVATGGADYGTGIFAVPAGTTTASSFGSGEVYIPNYNTHTKHSYLFDFVSESNSTSTGIYQESGAGLFHLMTPITGVAFYLQGGNYFAPNTTFTLYGISRQ
jgi:hypothetical protein